MARRRWPRRAADARQPSPVLRALGPHPLALVVEVLRIDALVEPVDRLVPAG